MTSANVTNYTIRNLKGEKVGKYQQHCYCKSKHSEILKFTPFEDYTIQTSGLDEEEEYWEGKVYNLRDFLGWLRVTGHFKNEKT